GAGGRAGSRGHYRAGKVGTVPATTFMHPAWQKRQGRSGARMEQGGPSAFRGSNEGLASGGAGPSPFAGLGFHGPDKAPTTGEVAEQGGSGGPRRVSTQELM